jgi:hypothetical protein
VESTLATFSIFFFFYIMEVSCISEEEAFASLPRNAIPRSRNCHKRCRFVTRAEDIPLLEISIPEAKRKAIMLHD